MAEATPTDVLKVIDSLVRNGQNPRVAYENLLVYAQRFAKKYHQDYPQLASLLPPNTEPAIRSALLALENEGRIELEKGSRGEIQSLFHTHFYANEIERIYQKIQGDSGLAFPTSEHLRVTPPGEKVVTVDVTQEIMEWIGNESADPNQILLLRFPGGTREMYTTVRVLKGPLFDMTLSRIRDYLRSEKNASYIETKLRTVFRTREVMVHEMLHTAMTRADDSRRSVLDPNEFQFHFWTQLSSTIIKEFEPKVEKLDTEHGYCQAAYLLGYYTVQHKNEKQQEKKKDEAFKEIRKKLVSPPTVFTATDIYEMVDERGITYSKRIGQQALVDFIKEMTAVDDENSVPELMTVVAPDRKTYFVHRSRYARETIDRINKLSPRLKATLIDRAVANMENRTIEAWMEDDGALDTVVDRWVKENDTILVGMLDFRKLFMSLEASDVSPATSQAGQRLFDRNTKAIVAWHQVFQLDRADIVNEARLRLPAWMLIPILRGLVRLFQRMFSSGGKSKPRKGKSASPGTASKMVAGGRDDDDAVPKGQSRSDQLRNFRSAIAEMQKAYLNQGQTPEQRLKELVKEWNPLIDKDASKNLVEDVNSLCRDTLRRMRYGARLAPPDRDRIQELASRIAENPTFERIRRRKAFQEYLELYMLTLLGKN